MKTIGINGLPASGKSTTAKILKQISIDRNKSAEIIELDFIFDNIKKRLPKDIIQTYEWTEETHLTFKNKPYDMINNKIILNIYKYSKAFLLNILVKKRLISLNKKNIKLAIIEGITIDDLLIPFDYLINISLDTSSRSQRRTLRESKLYTINDTIEDDNKNKEIKTKIIPYYDFEFANNGTYEELEKTSEIIYKKIFSKNK